MEDKDPNDEELNPQGQDDINDADDSFGLPDLDYKPLEEESEPAENESEEESEPAEKESEDTTDEASNESEMVYSSDSEESNEEFAEENGNEKTEFRYQIEDGKSNAPKILLGILGVLIVAAVIWFFGYYRPEQKKLAEDASIKQEQID